MKRPRAPKSIIETVSDEFRPAPEVDLWVKSTFLNEDHKIYNPHHAHLRFARIAYLWTNVANSRNMRVIAATAEIPMPPMTGGKWARAKWEIQMCGWFGAANVDFLITLNARILNDYDNLSFCATVDHELYHCAQARDEYNAPKFTKAGKPKFAILGHDVEEHTGVVERWGVEAGAGDTVNFVKAANRKPTIGKAALRAACGTCAR